jgi:hypothetical protein
MIYNLYLKKHFNTMNNQIHGKIISKANKIHRIYINFSIFQFVNICSKLKIHTDIYNFIYDNRNKNTGFVIKVMQM